MHLISARQFATSVHLDTFFETVAYVTSLHCPLIKVLGPLAKNKIMASLFYEPSTRTRFSFEAAMHRLEGRVISESNPANLSAAKGETLEDTIRTISNYADVIVLRHPEKGSAERAARVSDIPIINAGDGAGEHPTQALLDMYTIRQNFKFDGLKVLFCGDLLNGRTVHSLSTLLSLYDSIRLICCCPPCLSMPTHLVEFLKHRKKDIDFYDTIEEGLSQNPDVVYMTRLQRERLCTEIHGFTWNDYCLTPKLMEKLGEKALVMHPLPRNEELAGSIDNDPRCIYFTKQVKNGLKVRMGLLYCSFHNKICWETA